MTLEEARTEIKGLTAEVYIDRLGNGDWIVDGMFTMRQLEAIAVLARANVPPPV